jgi:hypothetical protein
MRVPSIEQPITDIIGNMEQQFANLYCVVVEHDRNPNTIHGPFDTFEEAEKWTEKTGNMATGTTSPLFRP